MAGVEEQVSSSGTVTSPGGNDVAEVGKTGEALRCIENGLLCLTKKSTILQSL
jgi:hypothetical protein